MTNKEAMELLYELKFETGEFRKVNALNIAIEALEMQIPKRPKNIRITNEWSDEKDEYKEYYGLCPNCEEADVHSGANYCYNCGQKLDWESEVEE